MVVLFLSGFLAERRKSRLVHVKRLCRPESGIVKKRTSARFEPLTLRSQVRAGPFGILLGRVPNQSSAISPSLAAARFAEGSLLLVSLVDLN
ncbi:hypothetical protein NL676_000211 [Syzygium grande]|nr:hypothetical protein NL676_000211 [Syzygium grande]